jgi:hypothetical protein
MEPEDTTSLVKGQRPNALDDEPAKKSSRSPSMSSEITEAPTWEALSSNSSSDDFSEGEGASALEAEVSEDSEKEGSPPLIKDLIDEKAMEATSNPEDHKAIENIGSVPTSKSVVKSGRSSPKVSKNNKGSKKNKEIAKPVAISCTQNIGRCMTSDVFRAYQMQCQAASYQMACAQQYMMAMQTFRMQQYYQQAQMATGSI